jgi:superfamily II DNA or RNA helicase
MKKRHQIPSPPSTRDWRTTDEDERNRRRLRAREEKFTIRNLRPDWPVFSNFHISSRSGMGYTVEIRDIGKRLFSCTCVDFMKNGLGTCKHVEAVLLHLDTARPRIYKTARELGSDLVEVALDDKRDTLRVERNLKRLPASVRDLFDDDGALIAEPESAVEKLRTLTRKDLRLSQEIDCWLLSRLRAAERKRLRREYEQKVHDGEYPQHETNVPLYPYQRQGMLHLAFTERALLADEMGLGKTIQAIAACALLYRLGTAKRALVVTPASLKTEWEEQIGRFTVLPLNVVYGARRQRLAAYADPAFFTIVNYEQVRSDALDINRILHPDVVVLDEAQRIKNWSTGTAQAVKRLRGRYAFVLTGTPVENRIDELYSIIEFLDPTLFGPLFRFNRDYYILDDKGRPAEYKNLEAMHEKLRTVMLRRRKTDVETELPARTDHNRFVAMNAAQRGMYEEHSANVARLVAIAKRRPLSPQEQDKLMRELAMMRMCCDAVYILDQSDKKSPKVDELETIFDEALENPEVKIVLFSEWVRMLELVKMLCTRKKIGYAWHTGSVPQRRRRAEINLFKNDPSCRVFLSSDSGGVGLNLQNASMVINCDLPWNPARLEQRIARVWRKHQKSAVTVINLVTEDSIEHRMLQTLAVKQGLADGILDRIGDFSAISLKGGAQSFFKRLEQVVAAPPPQGAAGVATMPLPADRSAGFARAVREKFGSRIVACEEHFPLEGAHSTLVVVVDRGAQEIVEQINDIHVAYFGPGKIDPLAPINLDVIDRATFEALRRLEEQGLIKRTVRATRVIPADGAAVAALTEEEQRRIEVLQTSALRRLKAARALLGVELADEARDAALEAALSLGKITAIRNGLPHPESSDQLIVAPWNSGWNGAGAALQKIITDPSSNCGEAVGCLAQLCASP